MRISIQQACNTIPGLQLCIGIHLGDVVFEGNDVFGGGVNIASRLQTIAAPGAIYISECDDRASFKPVMFHCYVFFELRFISAIGNMVFYKPICSKVACRNPANSPLLFIDIVGYTAFTNYCT
jgi:hypothetical protein